MKSKLAFIAVASIAVAVLLVGCGTGIRTGQITVKEFTPAYDIKIFCIKPFIPDGRCWYGGQIVTKHVADHWDFKLRNEKGDTGEVAVNEATFNRYKVGDWYDENSP